jgi:hypothetical protein
MQVGRAVALLAIAVLIGVVLLRHNGTSSGRIVSSSQTTVPPTTPKPSNTTASSVAHTTTTSSAPLRAPQDIKVLVANGTSTNGLATTVKSKLQGEGYQTLTSTNSSEQVTATIVYYRPGYQNEATALAEFLTLSPTAVQAMPAQAPVSNPAAVDGANIIVVAGPDVAQGGASTGGTTTTTVKSRTSSTTAGHTSSTTH